MVHSRKSFFTIRILLLAVLVAPLVAQRANDLARKASQRWQDRPHAADQNMINFIRPGITVKVVSAAIAKDGTITARVTHRRSKGTTSGYVRYLDARRGFGAPHRCLHSGGPEAVCGVHGRDRQSYHQQQSFADPGKHRFGRHVEDERRSAITPTRSPPRRRRTSTLLPRTRSESSAQRDLSEFITYAEWAETANDVYNFVPDGSKVKVIRSVTPTTACNQCHDPLIGHGGSRLTVEMCVLCHTPQTINPDTKLTQDMPVLIHKIHMGKNLPSVQGGHTLPDLSSRGLVGLLRCRLSFGHRRTQDVHRVPPERTAGGELSDSDARRVRILPR